MKTEGMGAEGMKTEGMETDALTAAVLTVRLLRDAGGNACSGEVTREASLDEL